MEARGPGVGGLGGRSNDRVEGRTAARCRIWRLGTVALCALAALACSRAEPQQETAPAGTQASTQPDEAFEAQVQDYLRKFPYQDTFEYASRYTGEDPTKLNTWVIGQEPSLVKAGEDTVVRMNNDTFYKIAFVTLESGPVILEAASADPERFSSFQLMDDRNVNYRNIIRPKGQYTLYHGDPPAQIQGEAVPVPSLLSAVIFRVEVKDKDDAEDVAAAKAVSNGIAIRGTPPAAFPQLDLLSGFPESVAKEAHRRMDEALDTIPFSKTVVGPGQEPGREVPVLNHAAGTKGGWGGPDSSHSAYETILLDAGGEEMRGSNGAYTVTTTEPPVDAFWSLTVYDTDRGGHFHPNPADRYHINNTAAVRSEDGTITFTFAQTCTETDPNCLEVPAGRFDVTARYYLPREEIRSGAWKLPGIRLR